MKLLQLLNGVKILDTVNYVDVDISFITEKSTCVTNGCMFICINGGTYNGHLFSQQAVGQGARVIVCQHKLDIDVTQIIVDDTRVAMSIIAKNFYDNAVSHLKVIGVVGTNGKTSVTYLINSALMQNGKKTAVIGTNGVWINSQHYDCDLTTPDPLQLHYYFSLMVDMGVEYVVMEVSAHAIYLKKMEGIKVDIAVFTNFSQDHLDFFSNMEEYKKAKLSFFNSKYVKIAVVNADDDVGQEIVRSSNLTCVSYGCDNPSDCFAIDVNLQSQSSSYVINLFDEVARINYNLSGKFNVYNTLAASVVSRIIGINIAEIVQGISSVKSIDGRNETVMLKSGGKVVVDFAHTPDGICNILSHLKSSCKGRLITVFGCGGNRDKFKRSLMAKAVSKYSDYAIITNDNPRYEDPMLIVNGITEGMSINHNIILDRKQAILSAINLSNSNDTIAILGKGSEMYQEINGIKHRFNDLELVNEYNI